VIPNSHPFLWTLKLCPNNNYVVCNRGSNSGREGWDLLKFSLIRGKSSNPPTTPWIPKLIQEWLRCSTIYNLRISVSLVHYGWGGDPHPSFFTNKHLRECFALCFVVCCVFGLLLCAQIFHKLRSEETTMEHPFFIQESADLLLGCLGFLGTGPWTPLLIRLS